MHDLVRFSGILILFLYSMAVQTQSTANMTESEQVNRLIFDSVASSPAFVSKTQFIDAWTAAVPYLRRPENATFLNPFEYPHFMNTAVMIGKISTTNQLAMYLAQVLYETNGLTIRNTPPCSRFGNSSTCIDYIRSNVNNTGGYRCNSYHGRGTLFIEDVDSYRDMSRSIFGNDIIYKHPKAVALRSSVAWAAGAWNWYTNVGSLIGTSDAFGLVTKFLRPGDCSSLTPTNSSIKAFEIYQQVLSVFSPDSVANSAGCVPNRK